jgi:hypothetical protein
MALRPMTLTSAPREAALVGDRPPERQPPHHGRALPGGHMGAEAIFHASLCLFCAENEIYTGHGMASLPVVAARRRTSTSCGDSRRCVIAHPSHYPNHGPTHIYSKFRTTSPTFDNLPPTGRAARGRPPHQLHLPLLRGCRGGAAVNECLARLQR